MEPELVDKVLRFSKRACSKHKISIYNEATHRGLLRHICVRESFASAELLVTFVLNIEESEFGSRSNAALLESLTALARELIEEVSAVVGFCVNFNNLRGNKILGDTTICISGKPVIEEVLRSKDEQMPDALKAGIKFRLSPTSFFQVNTEQAARLLEQVYLEAVKIKESLGGTRPFRIIDVYCGVGTISLWLSGLAQQVIAVEDNPAAIANGRENWSSMASKMWSFTKARQSLPSANSSPRAWLLTWSCSIRHARAPLQMCLNHCSNWLLGT